MTIEIKHFDNDKLGISFEAFGDKLITIVEGVYYIDNSIIPQLGFKIKE